MVEREAWTAEDDDQLFLLRSQGLSFSKIATVMERSKNSVIGRYGRQRKIRDKDSVAGAPVNGVPLSLEEIDRILELRKTGMVTPEIAKQIGRSARSVLKYIKRFTHAIELREKVITIAPCKEYKSAKAETYQCFSESGGVTLMELTPKMCRWPVGDPRKDDFRFCGDYAEPGKSYCCQHHALAYYRTAPMSSSRIKEMQRV